jgi:hypothetical protein
MSFRRAGVLVAVTVTIAFLHNRTEAAINVGLATSMDKVMIKGLQNGWPFEGWQADHYDLSLARNEHEAFQVVVWSDQSLSNVSVSASSLQPVGGGSAFNGTCKVWLVGHIKASDQPRSDLNIQYPSYLVDYTGGWWPDPLLTFTNTCSINANERVAFWVDVASNTNTPAGDYVATITVSAGGVSPVTLQLNVHVWDFALPTKPTLPTAFSIDSLWQASWVYGGDWSDSIRVKFLEMHQNHRLSVTEIYNGQPKGSDWFAPWLSLNNAFCLVKVPTSGSSALTSLYNYFTGLGRLNEAYVYGYDEVGQDQFQAMHDTFTAIHTTYPGLRTMTTAGDRTFGTSSSTAFVRPAVDIWVPDTTVYNQVAAQSLRAEGKDMWWYIAEGPRHPYANWYIQYPAIEARLLLGAMTFKYDAHGFLYYAVTNWGYNVYPTFPKNQPITSGPYTSWSPIVAYSSKNTGWVDGDGSLYCAGPANVGPLPTVRLENIRDGLEDYEYLTQLKSIFRVVNRCPTSPEQQAFVGSASALLAVPSDVVTSVLTYTRDSSLLGSYRQQVAQKIIEGQALVPLSPPDTDDDGVGDPCDNCPSIANPDQTDTDHDGLGNACDPDMDNDGVLNAQDNCPTTYNPDQADSDSDGIGNVCDNCPNTPNGTQVDTDQDGLGDTCDNCPSVANSDQADADSDGVGNVCDNCPSNANTNQLDTDLDGRGDVCDNDPFGNKWLDEEFDGACTGLAKTGSWDSTSMLARWPKAFGTGNGTFTAASGMNTPCGGSMNTGKNYYYRMTANLETDLSTTYGDGNKGLGTAGRIQGTDAEPLVLEFYVDFNGEASGKYSNFYMELSLDDGVSNDPAPRNGMATEDPDLVNGDQGPWTDHVVHRTVAFGSFDSVNLADGVTTTGTKGAPMYYDGTRWWYVKNSVNGVPVSLWKRDDGRRSLFRIKVKTNTVILEIDNLGGSPTNTATYEVPRLYLGGFNRLSMVMANKVSATGSQADTVDEIELRQGVLMGACCVRTGFGTGTCNVVLRNECENTPGGTYLGDGSNCSSCNFCPAYFGDMDEDQDVDQTDFGRFQACLTGPGPWTLTPECTCADRERDADVDTDDFTAFQACLQGPDTPANPACQR